jgi:hypothetical protein
MPPEEKQKLSNFRPRAAQNPLDFAGARREMNASGAHGITTHYSEMTHPVL